MIALTYLCWAKEAALGIYILRKSCSAGRDQAHLINKPSEWMKNERMFFIHLYCYWLTFASYTLETNSLKSLYCPKATCSFWQLLRLNVFFHSIVIQCMSWNCESTNTDKMSTWQLWLCSDCRQMWPKSEFLAHMCLITVFFITVWTSNILVNIGIWKGKLWFWEMLLESETIVGVILKMAERV